MPMLASHAYFKVWHAACASGEEVYSLAILLEEAGLLPRATIYATDFNDEVLQKGRDGIYPIANLQKASQRYQKAGGEHSLNRYYLAQNDVVQMSKPLRDAITWANHNLTIDQVFGEMNLIFCRNALIYFTQPLQNRALELFTKSLARGGVLCLGNKESLQFSSVSAQYLTLSKDERISRLNPADDPLETRAERGAGRRREGAWGVRDRRLPGQSRATARAVARLTGGLPAAHSNCHASVARRAECLGRNVESRLRTGHQRGRGRRDDQAGNGLPVRPRLPLAVRERLESGLFQRATRSPRPARH